jgi:hypothetical protein
MKDVSFLFNPSFPKYAWSSIEVNEMRIRNISKFNVVLCVICQPNVDSHRMREQR